MKIVIIYFTNYLSFWAWVFICLKYKCFLVLIEYILAILGSKESIDKI